MKILHALVPLPIALLIVLSASCASRRGAYIRVSQVGRALARSSVYAMQSIITSVWNPNSPRDPWTKNCTRWPTVPELRSKVTSSSQR